MTKRKTIRIKIVDWDYVLSSLTRTRELKMQKRFYVILLTFIITLTTSVATLSVKLEAKVSKYTWKESVAPNYVVRTGKAKISKKSKKGKPC